MIWGILFSYIDERRLSELINVGLSAALIVYSGIVKTIAQFVLETFNVTEYLMSMARQKQKDFSKRFAHGIMAAGMGERFGHYTDLTPKGFIPFKVSSMAVRYHRDIAGMW